jgi:hypothetical protein
MLNAIGATGLFRNILMQAAQSNAILSPVDVTLIRHRRQSEVLPPLGYLLRVKGRERPSLSIPVSDAAHPCCETFLSGHLMAVKVEHG